VRYRGRGGGVQRRSSWRRRTHSDFQAMLSLFLIVLPAVGLAVAEDEVVGAGAGGRALTQGCRWKRGGGQVRRKARRHKLDWRQSCLHCWHTSGTEPTRSRACTQPSTSTTISAGSPSIFSFSNLCFLF
jgi:hypothetical protein